MPRTIGLFPSKERVAEVGRYYGIMGNRIKEELVRLDIADFSEIEAFSVQDNIRKIVRQMNRGTTKWSRAATPQTYKENMRVTRVSLDILGASKDPLFSPKIHTQAIEALQDDIAGDFIKANLSINMNIATYVQLVRMAAGDLAKIQAFDLRVEEIVSGLIDEAVLEGESRGKVAQLIRIHFKRDLYERKFINISGRNYDMIKYGKMVARTRLRGVQSKATENMCAQYENDLVEISSHGTTTEVCKPYEGKVFSIGGKTPGYPTLDRWPPFHPNCEHSAAPTSLEAIEWRTTH